MNKRVVWRCFDPVFEATGMSFGQAGVSRSERDSTLQSASALLAYLMCTKQLLNSRARDLEEMSLISTLCAVVEDCWREVWE